MNAGRRGAARRVLGVALLALSASTSAADLTAVERSAPAPAIELADPDDRRHRLDDYLGRVVLVNFWATWCPPCLEELPSMQALWTELEDRGFTILGVNVGEERDAVSRFVDRFEPALDFPLLLDRHLATTRAWPVTVLPASFVIDREGNLRYRAVGERDWMSDEIRAKIDALLMD